MSCILLEIVSDWNNEGGLGSYLQKLYDELSSIAYDTTIAIVMSNLAMITEIRTASRFSQITLMVRRKYRPDQTSNFQCLHMYVNLRVGKVVHQLCGMKEVTTETSGNDRAELYGNTTNEATNICATFGALSTKSTYLAFEVIVIQPD